MGSKSHVILLAYKLESEVEVGYHLSIYVFEKEYSYGREGMTIEYDRIDKEPKKPEKIFMGYTVKTKSDLYDFIEEISKDWTAVKYNLLKHNCHHFAQEILKYLEITKDIPKKYTIIADTTALVVAAASVGGLGLGSGMSGAPITAATAISGTLLTSGSGIPGISSITVGSIIKGAFLRVGSFLLPEFEKKPIADVRRQK